MFIKEKPAYREEKSAFEHKNVQKERTPPQLYGTQYLLVTIALTGQMHFFFRNAAEIT